MFSAAALFAYGVVAAVMYLPRTGSRIRMARSIRKSLPVALFAMAAVAEGAPVLLIAALALSAVGDFALSRPGSKAFLIGMIAFAAAHLAYIIVMVTLGGHLERGTMADHRDTGCLRSVDGMVAASAHGSPEMASARLCRDHIGDGFGGAGPARCACRRPVGRAVVCSLGPDPLNRDLRAKT